MKDMKNNKNTIISMHEGVSGKFQVTDHCLIIKLKEDLDHHNSIDIRKQADKIIMNRNITDIIFDFSGLYKIIEKHKTIGDALDAIKNKRNKKK